MNSNNLVDINFHGNVFDDMRNHFKLAVNSVGEAMHAINLQTQQFLFKKFLDNDKKGIKYQILIDGKVFDSETPLTIDDTEAIKSSELVLPKNNLKTIDIIPIIEGAENGIGQIIIGAVLITLGIIFISVPVVGPMLIIAGIGLVAGGIISLLTSPPKFEDFREISGGGKQSYLFNGPQNRTREGGPVPVGYGRLIVGSQVIQASYEVSYASASSTLTS